MVWQSAIVRFIPVTGALLALALVAVADSPAPAPAEPKLADILSAKGDGPDEKGNTADDTWQFWFELAKPQGTYQRLTLHTTSLSADKRAAGIPRKVTGPVGGLLPNPTDTDGWILHTDWDGRFEGVWVDRKTGEILLYPYVEKNAHRAVAISYRVPAAGTYTISGKVTDVQVIPHPKHDGISWKVLVSTDGAKMRLLKEGGPIGDKIGPDSAEFKIEKVELKKGELVFLAIDPRGWWGSDLTRLDAFVVQPVE